MASKIAAIQLCSSDNVDKNLTVVASLIAEAAQEGAVLCVLPEMFAIIGNNASDKVSAKEVFSSGKIQDFLSAQAKKFNIWIVGGTIPIVCDQPEKVKAACIVYDNFGKVVARYDKIHLFDVILSDTESYKESDTTEPGDATVVVDTPVGRLGLAVCYDIRFPELFMELVNKGAEIIAIPSAFTVKTGEAHWQLLVRARAVDTFCYIIGSAQGGTHNNLRQTYGHTLITDPWGTIISEISESGNGIAYADIDLKKLHDIREMIPVHSVASR